jgi:hypothetical protein
VRGSPTALRSQLTRGEHEVIKQYGAFLLRWWRRDSGDERIQIEHIQSEAKTVVRSAPGALAWVEDQIAAHQQDGLDDLGHPGVRQVAGRT